jgi:hypothetical protein
MVVFMKIRQTVLSVLLAAAAACGGYYLRALREAPVEFISNQEWGTLEYFLTPRSFSEIESARALLDALAARYVTGVDAHRVQAARAARARTRDPISSSPALDAIQLLDEGIEQFKDTEQEFLLVQRLLRVLKQEKFHDRWLEVYLDTLYRRPTEELVGLFARDAVVVGNAAGRLEDVRAGFRHVCETPLDFAAKRLVQAAARDAGLPAEPTGDSDESRMYLSRLY